MKHFLQHLEFLLEASVFKEEKVVGFVRGYFESDWFRQIYFFIDHYEIGKNFFNSASSEAFLLSVLSMATNVDSFM